MPMFNGRTDMDVYIEWGIRVDQIFYSHNFTEEKKVCYASIEFIEYALVWWNQLCCAGERPNTWEHMKNIMRRQFMLTHYTRTLHTKLQRLHQCSLSVDDYYKEMKILMIHTGMNEPEEVTMARFFEGLNDDVQEKIESSEYNNL